MKKILGKSWVTLSRKSVLLFKYSEQQRRQCELYSISPLQQQNRLRVSQKLCLNLCSRRWLKTSRNRVSNFTPLELWQLKILFQTGLRKVKIFVLKVEVLSELGIFLSNLLHSEIADAKKVFFKKLWLILNRGILSQFLVW